MSKRKSIYWIIIGVVIIFLLRVFAYQTIKTDSYKMSSTILPQDRVLISKFWTGARFPNTLLGLPGAERKYIDKFRIPTFRLPAIAKIKRNSIILFNNPQLSDKPIDRKPVLLSRVVAIPGDTVIVWDKNLYINRTLTSPPETARREYRVVTSGQKISEEFLEDHSIESPEEIADIGIYDVYLDTLAYQEISSLSSVKQIRPQLMRPGDSSLGYWPYSSFFKWNRDQVGPLIVPYKGLTIDIDMRSIDHYRDLIENHEGNEILIDYQGIYVNGELITEYTFSKDYFFVLDDNRDNPNDSRLLGYIPHDHVIGKASIILRSPHRKKPLVSLKKK